jgi:predicted DNA-binding transcriptional regulator YafY
MPKRPDNLETLLLALELLKRIPRNRKISAPELHAQLNEAGLTRDLRTIQRQLEVLTSHFDIERDDRNKPYGYRWKERAAGMSVPMLSRQESLLLMLAEQHLKNLLPASLMKSMDGFFNQARSNLGNHADAKLEREWLSKVRVVSTTQPLLPPRIRPGIFEEISDALYANRWLEVEYKNAKGRNTRADVMPLGLAQQGPRLYLVCRFKGFENERSLAVHRILAATSGLPFIRTRGFDLGKYDDDGRFGFGQGRFICLKFRISKGAGLHLLESPLSANQTIRVAADYFEISANVVETSQLEWWLRGFGDEISHIQRQPA